MKKYRIYIVDHQYTDASIEEIENWDDSQFMDESERQGFVYSLEGFQNEWNLGNIGYCDFSTIRIIPFDA